MSAEELIAEAEMGDAAEKFMDSELGRYFIGCCDQEISDALMVLKNVNPRDYEAIERQQNVVHRAEGAKRWFRELIDNGIQALEVLKNEQTQP